MNISMDLPLLLVILILLTGTICLLNRLFLADKRQKSGRPEPWWVDYSRSFFPVFIIILIIRSFIFQLYRVPTGSLVPTILPGDLVFVEQYAYGLRLPITNTKLIHIGEPKRGDIAVFYSPPNPKIIFIKRIIGLPGDHIVYKNKTLSINGVVAKQKFIKDMAYHYERSFNGKVYSETITNKSYQILIDPKQPTIDYDFVVPKGYYFAMGDDRDDSADSRFWGFVPEHNLIGKAWRIIFSWDGKKHDTRWHRIGNKL